MSYTKNYFDTLKSMLDRIETEEHENILACSRKIVETTISGGMIYIFGATHAGILSQEAMYRTGGLVNINPIFDSGLVCSVVPITDTSKRERINGLGKTLLEEHELKEGDILILHSVSGRNPVVVDMCLAAKEKNIFTVGITSLAYSSASISRAASGLRLFECCDLVIDNKGIFGDSCVDIPGLKSSTAPSSSVTGCAIINAICAEACAMFVEKGIDPPVYVSANIDGGDEKNARILDEYKDRITYMDTRKNKNR